MHLLLPHAAPAGPNCQAAIDTLELPQLRALLRLLGSGTHLRGDASTLTPLSEQLHARSLGLDAPDGLLPWAALEAQRLQHPPAGAADGWGWITPCHWEIHSDHVGMSDPQTLALDATESATLLDAMRGYFAEDGLALHPGASPGHWLASGALLKDLPTASLERVSAASVDRWLCRLPQARPLRRLQNEMQMLLYTHPVNTARAARKLPLVTSFWVSGTGTLTPAMQAAATPGNAADRVDTLRRAALDDDASRWQQAWQAFDQEHVAALLQAALRGADVALTLCGAQAAQTLRGPAPGLWRRMHNRWHASDPKALLRSL